MTDIYSLVKGATYVVKKDFTDFRNQLFSCGDKLTFIERHFLPYDGGHTFVFKQKTLYLQEEINKNIIDDFDAYISNDLVT